VVIVDRMPAVIVRQVPTFAIDSVPEMRVTFASGCETWIAMMQTDVLRCPIEATRIDPIRPIETVGQTLIADRCRGIVPTESDPIEVSVTVTNATQTGLTETVRIANVPA